MLSADVYTLRIRGEMVGDVKIARSFRERLVGMAWFNPPPILFFPNCRFVHTLLPCHRLHIYFLDREGYLLSVRRNVARGRFCLDVAASHIIESRGPLKAFPGDRFAIVGSSGQVSLDFDRETNI